MYEPNSAVEGRGVPVAYRTGPHLTSFIKITISADKSLSTRADSRRWVLGSAQPAIVPGGRLPEPVLRLKDPSGESRFEIFPADVRVRYPGPGDFSHCGDFPGRGYFPADKLAAVFSPDTVSALERDRHPYSHDRPAARRRSASPPGGDPLPATRPRPFPAGGSEPWHLPKPPTAPGESPSL